METSGESDWAQGAVRCYCYVVCFCHCGDSTELGDAAAVGNIYALLVSDGKHHVHDSYLAG